MSSVSIRRPAVDLRRIAALFLLGVTTSGLLYFEIGKLEQRSKHYEFERYVGNLNLAAHLQKEIDRAFGPLRRMAAPVAGASFDDLCRQGLKADPSLLSCGLAEAEAKEAQGRHFPIVSYHKQETHHTTQSQNLFSRPEICATIESALADNRLSALPLDPRADEDKSGHLLLLFAPMAGAERGRVVFGLFNITLLVQAALGTLPPQGISYYLDDITIGPDKKSNHHLYVSRTIRSGVSGEKILFTERLFVAGRSWLLSARPAGDFIAAPSRGHAFLALLASLMVTILVTGYLFFLSRQNRMVEKLVEERMEELTHANRLKALGEMAAQVAHELNQPLTGAMNYAEIASEYLAMGEPDIARVQTKIGKIIEQIRRAKHVMTGLRDFARQKETLEDDVSVNWLVEEAITLLEPRLKKESVRLTRTQQETLPTIKGDALRLEQVALNLINNAIDATGANSDERHIHVQTGRCKQEVMVKVSDNGRGFAGTDIHRLFDPFYTTKAPDGGSGLGLAICQRIVKEHGGSITAEGEPGLGAVFTVYLPSAENEEA